MNTWISTPTFAIALSAVSSVCLAGPTAGTQVKNNNHLIEHQKGDAGDPALPGDVSIQFYGHAAFKIVSPVGFSMLFDPWRNDPSGYWGVGYPEEFPEIEVDAVLSTHAHFDHDATERPNGQMILDRMTGTYGFADVNVEGLAYKHQCEAPGWYKWTDSMAPRLGTARVAAEPSEKTASVVIQDAKDLVPPIQQLGMFPTLLIMIP